MEPGIIIPDHPSPILNPPPAPVKKTHRLRNFFLWFFGIIIFLVVAFLNLPRILTLIRPGDAPPPDDSALLLKKISIPDEQNGFFALSQINPDSIYRPPGNSNFDLDYTNYKEPIKWDQALVDDVLQKNQAVLDLFNQVAEKEYFQVPDYQDPANINVNVKLYPMNGWRGAARLQAIKALSLSWQGKPDEALREAVKISSLGHKIINSQNSLIGTLVGISIQLLGSQTILEILPYGNPTKDALVEVEKDLQNVSDNTDGYQNAFRFEYTTISNEIDTITEGIAEGINQMVKNGTADPAFVKYAKYGYYYKPNQTKNLYYQLYQQEVSAVGVRCELEGQDDQLISENLKKVVPWKLVFQENAIGRLLFSVTGLSLGSALTKECQNDLAVNVAQTELALRAYKIDNGSLPSNLDALVPQYLPAVPMDPFDKQPIRYEAQKQIIYSVGVNKKDLGGSEGDDWTKMENPTFKIKF